MFVRIDPKLYFIGSFVGCILSVSNSLYWNNRFVFHNSDFPWWQKLLRTYVAYGGCHIVGTVTLTLQVSVLGVSKWLAPWINMVITTPLNFLMNKFWTFMA